VAAAKPERGILATRRAVGQDRVVPQPPQETAMGKEQVNRGKINKPKLTTKDKKQKKKEKAAKK
jgi:hypothetical protein